MSHLDRSQMSLIIALLALLLMEASSCFWLQLGWIVLAALSIFNSAVRLHMHWRKEP